MDGSGTQEAAPTTRDGLELVTASRFRAARKCRRLHWYRYVQLRVPLRESEDLFFGSLVHRALEAWWKSAQLEGAGEHQLERMIEALRAEPDVDPFDLVRAEVLCTAYHYRWSPTVSTYRVLGVEVEFRTLLVNPETGAASRTYELGGKLDVLVEEIATQRLIVIEHKTSSEDLSPGADYWVRLQLDGQVSTYFDGGQALTARPVDAVLYDVIGKPGLKPLKATPMESRKYKKGTNELYANQRAEDETPEEHRARLLEAVTEDPNRYLARQEVPRLESELEESRADRWAEARAIREEQLAGRRPRNPDACITFGTRCPYWDVCTGVASIDDQTRFRATEAHPELSGATTTQQAPEEGATS